MLVNVITVPARTSAVAVYCQIIWPPVKTVPFHSSSLKKIVVPAAIGCRVAKATSSLPESVSMPVNAIEPGPRAMASVLRFPGCYTSR
jgi:hypothetical protein